MTGSQNDCNGQKARKFGSKFHDFHFCLKSTIDSQKKTALPIKITTGKNIPKVINEMKNWLIIL